MTNFLVFSIVFSFADAMKNSLDVFVMGDWGGTTYSPYTTPDEVDTSILMGQLGDKYNVDQIWAVGDNFYQRGIVNEYDPRFQETFENVFIAPSIKNIPYYFCAGNHDHFTNVSGQIYYSNHSTRWNFPDLFYNVIFPIPGSDQTVELVMIDTVILTGITQDLEYCDSHNISNKDCLIEAKGPSDKKLADSGYEWINNTLKASTANYLIVSGHYPIFSVGAHGTNVFLVNLLNPMLIENNVTAYFAGHDHTFEYIDSGNGIGYIVTGAAHVCDPTARHANTVPQGWLKFHDCQRKKGGFTHLRFDANQMNVDYYFGDDMNSQFSVSFKPRF